MIVRIDLTFEKEVEKVRNIKIREQIFQIIENVKVANSPDKITGIKKLKGYKFHYRIRIGDYRIGLIIKDNTADFVRFLHRKDIYKRFP